MTKLKTTVSISVLALAVLVAGCSKGSDGAVLAKVNRTTITEADFKSQLRGLTPQMQHAVVTSPTARKEFLEDLIGIELVLQEAKKQGLDKDPGFLQRQKQYKEEMERQLQEETKNDLFNSLLKKELGDQMDKVPPATDQEVAEYFKEHKAGLQRALGRKVTLKEVAPQLKVRLTQEKKRDVYLAYAKKLKAKAAISINEKALDDAIAALNQPLDMRNLTVKKLPAPGKGK
jgi:peptidyl-prolyl cis-trans isomerase C